MTFTRGIAISTLVLSFIIACNGALPEVLSETIAPYPSASTFVRRGFHWSHIFDKYLYVSGGELVWQNGTNRLMEVGM
jgi:hypothetical protein